MNLIEQLGGYEKARTSLQWLIENDEDYVQFESNLYAACLEYRRQHNIFEVGEWVFVGDDTEISQFVGYCYEGTIAQLPQVKKNGRIYNSHFAYWSHATPQEIEAGKRL